MASDTKQTTILPGTVLAGKYRVERVIGSGGMGVVVAATHLELRDTVAVKFLQPAALENKEVAERFVREARAAVRIKSEHVARVIDVGRLENGAPYMVMEYLEGHDLGEAKYGERIPIEDAVDYVIQACDAMAEAHAAGIVHRDLKPANLFLTTGADGAPVVKVLDFGISKVSLPDLASLSLTRTATAMGSPLYMSPEQMRSAKGVDHRTDIWALGVILFELLSGKTPFTAGSLPELCASILADAPANLRELRPEAPEALVAVVLRCLEKDAGKRYPNIAELALALAPFAPRRSRSVVERVTRLLSRAGMSDSLPPASVAVPVIEAVVTDPIGQRAGGVTGEGARTNASWSETRSGEPKRTSAIVIGVALGVVLVALGIAFVATKASSASAQPPVAASSNAPVTTVETPDLPVRAAPSASSLPESPSSAAAAPEIVKTEKPKRDVAKTVTEPKKVEPAPAKPKNPLDIGLK